MITVTRFNTTEWFHRKEKRTSTRKFKLTSQSLDYSEENRIVLVRQMYNSICQIGQHTERLSAKDAY